MLYTTILCVYVGVLLLSRFSFDSIEHISQADAPQHAARNAILLLVSTFLLYKTVAVNSQILHCVFTQSTIVLAVSFGFAVSMLLGLHIYLLLKNRSTIEDSYDSKLHVFDVGRARNVRQVFGYNNWLCLLPVYTSVGNGIDFPRVGFGGNIVV